jgi:hypothetical protein
MGDPAGAFSGTDMGVSAFWRPVYITVRQAVMEKQTVTISITNKKQDAKKLTLT